jgi:beta-lactamase superfamily II metal-dependent hydrolase
VYEVDFLPVGQGGRHGDAIAIRFTRPDAVGYSHVIVDSGFEDSGRALVAHFDQFYGTRSVDLAILTHPDGDHIGGMGVVIREMNVETLCLHRLGDRGGRGLPAATAVDDLIAVAEANGTRIYEPFAGHYAFDGMLRFLGPDEAYYAELVAEQQAEAGAGVAPPGRVRAAVRALGDRFAAALPVEVPFDDGPGTNPRNNSSIISLLDFGGHRVLLTSDAGVPALNRAWDWLEGSGLGATAPDCIDLAHHGSRRNASSELLNRILGPIGQPETRTAIASVGPDAKKHPSPRVVNAHKRRGCRVIETRTQTIHHFGGGAPDRGWPPATPLGPMDESDEED